MSTYTAATPTIQISQEQKILMLSMELGETGWLLGFASAYGQKPLRRKIASRDRSGRCCARSRGRGRCSAWRREHEW